MNPPNTQLPPHSFKKTSEPDICNVCLKTTKLTFDHVPPEAALPVSHAKVRPLFARADRPRYSQSGVKFRTLCGRCNGDRLGGDYDKALLEMCKQARRLHRNAHLIRQLPHVEIDPGKVVRSIFGHMLAAKDHTPLKKQRLRAAVIWGRGTSGSRAATATGHAPSGRRAEFDLVPEAADPTREA